MNDANIQFAESASIDGLSERCCLASIAIDTRSRFVTFPEETVDCTPKRFPLLRQNLPRFSFFEADEVHLAGNRLFSVRGKNFTDASLTDTNLDQYARYFNGKLSQGNRENIGWAHAAPAPEIEIGGYERILVACSDEPSNFGSWIFRFLPKLILAKEHAEFDAVFVYQPPWLASLTGLAGLDCAFIPHDPSKRYVIKRPIIPSLPVPYAYFRSELRKCLAKLHDRQDDEFRLGERLYISRRASAVNKPLFRVLENETGLVDRLQGLGFVEFTPEHYTIAQQISIFDKAKVIVGCGGSNMFGCIFARNAELIIDIESGDEWAHAHANLLASTDAKWSMIRGRRVGRGTPPHENWTIDIEAVGRGVSRLLD